MSSMEHESQVAAEQDKTISKERLAQIAEAGSELSRSQMESGGLYWTEAIHLARELKQAREKLRWRDVDEELPPTPGKYLVLRHGLLARVGTFGFHVNREGVCFDGTVTHWMPLPSLESARKVNG